jgi:hypothetical protein
MRRAPAEQLPALAERMAVVVAELEVRRAAREGKRPATVIPLGRRRQR